MWQRHLPRNFALFNVSSKVTLSLCKLIALFSANFVGFFHKIGHIKIMGAIEDQWQSYNLEIAL